MDTVVLHTLVATYVISEIVMAPWLVYDALYSDNQAVNVLFINESCYRSLNYLQKIVDDRLSWS